MNQFCLRRLCTSLWTAMLAIVSLSPIPADQPPHSLDLGGGVWMEMMLIAPGTFTQGSPANEVGRGEDEVQHQVTISSEFYLAKSPVTRGQFARFVTETGYRTEAEKGKSGGSGLEDGKLVQKPGFTWRKAGFTQTDDHPVVLVTYDDALAFLKWLSTKSRQDCQLPTESQWEYACRAGTTSPFYNGTTEEDADAIAWFKANAGNGTRPVGQKKPNAYGLVDMAGNVAEWCRDWYGPYSTRAATDPLETRSDLSDKPRRVLRGGSWFKDVKNCRSAARFKSTPGSRNADFGFRVAFHPTSNINRVETPTQPATRPASQAPAQSPPANFAVPAQPSEHSASSPAPAPVPADRTTGISILGYLCPCAAVLAVVAIAAFLVVRNVTRRTSQPETYPIERETAAPPSRPDGGKGSGSRVRIVSDGFWLDDPAIQPGSVARYSCIVNRAPMDGEFTVGGGSKGQFVYTGGTPSNVQIVEIRPPTTGFRSQTLNDPFQTGTIIGTMLPSSTPIPPPPPRTTPPPPPAGASPQTGRFPSAY